jgi:hypothetical protein
VSVASTAKASLVGASGVLAGLLPGVVVGYSPSKNSPREEVYAGDVAGPVTLQAFAGGGRVRRSEELSFPLVIRVYKPGQETTETAEARADEIGDVIGDYIAANWTLGDLAELKKATVAAVALAGWIDDDGAGAVLTLTVELMSYRT